MSKIYDALQRAEQERELVSAETVSSAVLRTNAVLEHPQTIPLPRMTKFSSQREVSSGTEDTFSSADNSLNSVADGTDLANVQKSVWIPDWQKLPSLDTRGPLLEQFRSLRSRMHELRAKNPLKSCLISSGLPQEGKSFVAANLALALASGKGNRVLLIDGDMRRASIHTLLGAKSLPGLSDFLGGKASLAEVLQQGVSAENQTSLPSAFASLTFIGAGGAVENAADLSGSRRFNELLQWAASYFDWVIVDSSPVNLVADSVNLARACDGVVFIVRSGQTRLEFAKRALEELKASKLLGVILNAVEDLPASHSYYGYPNGEAGEDWDPAGR